MFGESGHIDYSISLKESEYWNLKIYILKKIKGQ